MSKQVETTKEVQKEERSELRLVLDTGGEIKIDHPDDTFDEMWNELQDCLKADSLWSPEGSFNAYSTFNGVSVDSINMKRVVAVIL